MASATRRAAMPSSTSPGVCFASSVITLLQSAMTATSTTISGLILSSARNNFSILRSSRPIKIIRAKPKPSKSSKYRAVKTAARKSPESLRARVQSFLKPLPPAAELLTRDNKLFDSLDDVQHNLALILAHDFEKLHRAIVARAFDE